LTSPNLTTFQLYNFTTLQHSPKPTLQLYNILKKMPQFTFTNNTYAGEALAGFMASTLLEADSVKRGLLTVINDVKSRKVILDAVRVDREIG